MGSTSASSTKNPTRRLVAEHPGVVRFGKAGWLAKGVVYCIAGVLALVIVGKARGWSVTKSTPNQEASPTGALKTVAHTSFGPLLLWLLAIGLVIYAAWRFVCAALPADSDAKVWVTRLGYVISGAIYLSLAWTAVRLARSSATQTDGNSKVSDATAATMEHTAGRLLIGLVGLIVIGVGVYRVVKGVKDDVADELDLGGMSSTKVRTVRTLGRVGECGRGIGIGLVGLFLLIAAVAHKPNDATGLDGALRRLAIHGWGTAVVAVVGLGFLAYGVFCVVTFTHRRLRSA